MSTTTGVKTPAPVSERAVTFQMWVPCMAMAACSWLAFVDRQVLAVLSPTILMETGMSGQEYGSAFSFFFYVYAVANLLWGSLLDFLGLRFGMVAAVAIWSIASASHGLMSGFWGFAFARGLLGLGEGATFPGGLRTAVESLPSKLRARGIATSFSGGTIGAIVTPTIAIFVGLKLGWRWAFYLSGLLGAIWIVLWLFVARPPYLPKREQKPTKIKWPNPFERRFWALVSSYALPAVAPGPILTIIPLYLTRGLHVSQTDLGDILWMPPLAWGIGYFFWGWVADRFAADKPRPVGLFALLTVFSLAFGLTTWTSSVMVAMLLISWGAFIGGGFQMVALKVGSYAFPREQAAMMSGIASGSFALANALLSPRLGRLLDQQQYALMFWIIALCPLIGVLGWVFLSRRRVAQS
ncbi:MAG TPA: MFS transporter [Terriglobia bacterium]|nr:MFS transporter [Terriglobia bacterium]